MSNKNNIVFIGFPGSGKSYVGKMYSIRNQMKWVDIDREIEKKYKARLIDMLNANGNERFCELETEMILSMSGTHTVFSPGGSVIYNDEAMKHFSYTLDCTIVFLDTPYDVICKRLGDWSTRGIIVPPGNTLKTLYNQRWDLYKYYADIHVKETELNDILARVSEEIEVL